MALLPGGILRSIANSHVAFWCPGCNETHVIPYGEEIDKPRWTWNGNTERPTFQPSINIKTIRKEMTQQEWEQYDDVFAGPNGAEVVLSDPRFRYQCHSFVTEGRIQFCGDSTHELANQTVDLPLYPTGKRLNRDD